MTEKTYSIGDVRGLANRSPRVIIKSARAITWYTCHKVAAQAALQPAPDAAYGVRAPDMAIHEKNRYYAISHHD